MSKSNNLTDFVRDIANQFRLKFKWFENQKIDPQDFSDYIIDNYKDYDMPTFSFDPAGLQNILNLYEFTCNPAPSIPNGYVRCYRGTASLRSGTTLYEGLFWMAMQKRYNSISGIIQYNAEAYGPYGGSQTGLGSLTTLIDGSYNRKDYAAFEGPFVSVSLTPTESFDIKVENLLS